MAAWLWMPFMFSTHIWCAERMVGKLWFKDYEHGDQIQQKNKWRVNLFIIRHTTCLPLATLRQFLRQKITFAQLIEKFHAIYEIHDSFRYSEIIICACYESQESSPPQHILLDLTFIGLFPFIYAYFQQAVSSSFDLPIKTVYALLISSKRSTYHPNSSFQFLLLDTN